MLKEAKKEKGQDDFLGRIVLRLQVLLIYTDVENNMHWAASHYL